MSKWGDLQRGLTDSLVKETQKILTPEKWDLLSDTGKAEMASIGAMMVECQMLEAAGIDVSVPRRALKAAMGNWKVAVMVKGSTVGDEILRDVKEAMVSAGEVVFKMLGAGLRGLVLGL